MTDSEGGADGGASDRTTGIDLFEAHPDPALCFGGSDETLALAVNPAFEETFGTSAAAVTGSPLDRVTMTDELDGLGDRLEGDATVDETVACETVTGRSTFRVRAVRTPATGGVLLYTPIGDGAVTSERERERVEELARVVSHELRNPIDSVRARVEAARDTGEVEHLDTALRNVDRMASIISDLTTLAREGRLVDSRDPVDLAATVEEAWRTVDASGATLTVAADTGRVLADDGALEHLLENLLRNSVEHGSPSPASQARQDSVEHGSTSNRPSADDSVEHGSTGSRQEADDAVERDDHVTITVGTLDPDRPEEGFYVADDGPGVSEEDREQVFEAGYSTSREGTGLGLRIVERVAEAHGWSVAVTESEAGGARFEVVDVERPDDQSG